MECRPADKRNHGMIRPEDFTLWLGIGSLGGICVFILSLLVWRNLHRNAQPDPATREAPPRAQRALSWTMAPAIALALAVVALTLRLYFQDANPNADVTVLVSGKMWFWTYKYPDHGNFSFNASMLADADAHPAQSGTYDHIVVPVGKTVRIVAAANDVIYSWEIPAIGARIEALPGQTEQSWFRASDEGRYFGNCSELCGLPHAFRPIEVEVVSEERFNRWVTDARRRLLSAATPHRAKVQ
jgi:cytochrome c oxidase subunit 2